MKLKRFYPLFVLFIVLALIGATGSAVYFYRQYTVANKDKIQAQQDTRDFMKAAGSALLLPKEDPVIATVSDKSKLQEQLFFKTAENGDKVFIYPKAGLAVLFRPSIGKVIPVSTIQSNTTPIIPTLPT